MGILKGLNSFVLLYTREIENNSFDKFEIFNNTKCSFTQYFFTFAPYQQEIPMFKYPSLISNRSYI